MDAYLWAENEFAIDMQLNTNEAARKGKEGLADTLIARR